MNIVTKEQLETQWEVKLTGYIDSTGTFQKTSPMVSIVMVARPFPGSYAPVAKELHEEVAQEMVASHNAKIDAKAGV